MRLVGRSIVCSVKCETCNGALIRDFLHPCLDPRVRAGKGGKNRRRGKNENEETKRDLIFKEDGQGEHTAGGSLWVVGVCT